MKPFGAGVFVEKGAVVVAAADYLVLPRSYGEQSMLSPFEVSDRQVLEGSLSDDGSIFEESFRDFEQLWSAKWHGKDEGLVDSDLSSQGTSSSLTRILRRTLSNLNCRLKGSPTGLRGAEYLWDLEEPRGLFSTARWKRMFSNKPIEPKHTKSGPCELFADLPIPPYPSDYEWDD